MLSPLPILAIFATITSLIIEPKVSGFSTVNEVKIVKWSDLEEIMGVPDDTVYVINFWASWCKPCVAELPYFEKMALETHGQKISVLLVNLDFTKDLSTRVLPFVQKKNLQCEVWHLNEPDPNLWMTSLDKDWDGEIPATLFLDGSRSKKKFIDREISYDSLRNNVSYFLDEDNH